MATLVGLTQGQIDRLLVDLEQVENGLKSMYDELAQLPVPRETLSRYSQIHNRYSSVMTFLHRQQELVARDRSAPDAM